MKLIKPKFQHIPLLDYEEGMIVNIEQAARTCYKSEGKFECIGEVDDWEGRITDADFTTVVPFIKNAISGRKLLKNTIIDRGHLAVLEFGYHPIISLPKEYYDIIINDMQFTNYLENELDIEEINSKYFTFTYDEFKNRYLISASIRTYREYFKYFIKTNNVELYDIELFHLLYSNYKFLFEDLYEIVEYNTEKLGNSIVLISTDDLSIFETVHHIREHYLITCDRGVSHELVRHRPVGYAQESTRYCNYSEDGKIGEVGYIDIYPHLKNPLESLNIWLDTITYCEIAYNKLIAAGEPPQIARSVLPNSLKTEINMIANLQEWHHIFTQRTSKAAHPQMREIMIPMLKEFQSRYVGIFDNIKID